MSIETFLSAIKAQGVYRVNDNTNEACWGADKGYFHIEYDPEYKDYCVTVTMLDLTYSASRPNPMQAYRRALHMASLSLKQLRGEQGAALERFIVERQVEALDE